MNEDKLTDSARKLIARAWADPEFKQQLIKDPKRHLAEAGLLEDNLFTDPAVNVTVYEGPRKASWEVPFPSLWLPPKPQLGESVTDELFAEATEFLLRACSAVPNSPMTTCCCDITVAPRIF